MSTSWQVNGIDMDDADVTVIVDITTDVSETTRIRWQREKILHGSEEGHRLGEDLPRVRIRFSFHGPSPERYERMALFRNYFIKLPRLSIQAPDAPNEFYLFEDDKIADLEPENVVVNHHGGLSHVSLEVTGALHRNLPAGGVGGPAVGEGAVGEEAMSL